MERERKESAKGAEFRHKTPGIPCPPHKSPPCREVSEREREAKARGKGSSGKKTLPSGPRRWRRNAKKDSDWTEEVYTNFDSSPMTGTSDVLLTSKAVERRGKTVVVGVVRRKEFGVRVKGFGTTVVPIKILDSRNQMKYHKHFSQ